MGATVLCLVNLIGILALLGLLFAQAFFSSDPADCYYAPSASRTYEHRLELEKDTSSELRTELGRSAVNMGNIFYLWCRWGFMLFVLLLLECILHYCSFERRRGASTRGGWLEL